ncbi:TPA: hypothetical protein ACUWRN_002959 [Listeria monocytogenes]
MTKYSRESDKWVLVEIIHFYTNISKEILKEKTYVKLEQIEQKLQKRSRGENEK